ncbi:TPA: chromosomal replication initiator protein DnaA [Streptococcus suis]|uniref:Chromosomal replication initiator protein DnaA n=2 Tax=Streptococcus suis TaxID=1307 RepID=D5AF51_STRGZ|nr:chromosomal replication initiator protein DnaA [Streptococcus suis]ABP91161.1 ATPase involved in DNA replication initiation [Streptococcus suis 05ZYH33]ABP93350.1 ATPase involved in DNA replication initiation [Streptococcus suis 98HAH33]ADE30466.1 chromosomal replication initiator protein, DnaA [Streptococcus suis GZ1]ADV69115.1 chromosomal replication initiator protein [Streptococcus suis JS14]AER14204.1 chromosomal replication initiation protein [Streptococcus suis SS12]
MNQEQLFWQRFIELAKVNFKPSIYDFYVADAKLLGINQQVANIFLNRPFKKDFWEKNFEELMIAASFESYGEPLTIQYQFTEDEQEIRNTTNTRSSIVHQVQTLEPATPQETFKPVHSDIKSQYTFANFVQGDNNHWAKAAALAVSDNLGELYNPLFIFGGPGLGKTHILNAIGNKVLADNPQARIKYVSSETFINEFLEHLRLNDMESFKKTYRNLDLLLIDDIQSLRNKATTQEEFFHTFNALHEKNKQIVLTSDRNPDHLDNLEERLVTRFKWGLTSEITPPDFETRIAILRNKCENLPYNFTNETLSYLAGQFDSNVRDLEGALKDIHLIATMRQLSEISVEVAAEAIRSRKQTNPQNMVIPIEKIQTEVGNFYGVSLKELKGSKRVQHIVHARQVAMFLAREMTDNSLPKIGKEFGNRDHTTVMHAYNKIKTLLLDDENLEIEITSIKNKLR